MITSIGAAVQGSEHAALGLNCQDAHVIKNMDSLTVMVLCDGVSGGKDYRNSHNEVGAWLQATYAADLLSCELWPSNPFTAFEYLVTDFWRSHLKYIQRDKKTYAKNYLSATLLAAMLWDEGGYLWACGDGIVQIDDEIIWRDEGGVPNVPVSNVWTPKPFWSYQLNSNWKRVALMSDGMYPRKSAGDPTFDESRFREMVEPGLWGHSSSLSLKRQLNAWRREEHPYFYDDATVVMAYR